MTNPKQPLPVFIKVLIGLVIVLFSVPVLTFSAALLRVLNSGSSSVATKFSEWEGRSSPDLAFTTTDGASLRLSQLRGRAVILDFWATWCGPCIREIPHLQKLADESPQDLVVIGISSEDLPALNKFAASNSLGYQIGSAVSPPSPYSDITAIPTTFFIDREGTIRKVLQGYHDYAQLSSHASKLIRVKTAIELDHQQ